MPPPQLILFQGTRTYSFQELCLRWAVGYGINTCLRFSCTLGLDPLPWALHTTVCSFTLAWLVLPTNADSWFGHPSSLFNHEGSFSTMPLWESRGSEHLLYTVLAFETQTNRIRPFTKIFVCWASKCLPPPNIDISCLGHRTLKAPSKMQVVLRELRQDSCSGGLEEGLPLTPVPR